MTTLVISVLRIGGLVFAAIGVILFLITIGTAMQLFGYGNMPEALAVFLPALYPVVVGAALYGFGEVISLLMQIRDKA